MNEQKLAKHISSVLIIVPIYRDHFAPLESIAYMQLRNILGHYPIAFIVPEKYRELYAQRYPHRTEAFPDRYFQGTETYSQLLLSSGFYERFREYEYILIYQLDAFVFADKLNYFCSLGYDYIGAPLPRWVRYWRDVGARVGNGGLSLRRVSAMLRILREQGNLIDAHFLSGAFQRYEDLFFAYCGTLSDGLKVPSVPLALEFSVENDVGHCYKKIAAGGKLPFGCHAWAKNDYPFWKKIIETYGYRLPDHMGGQVAASYRRSTLLRCLIARLARASARERARNAARQVLCGDGYAVWGYGQDGKALVQLLKAVEVRVDCVMDRDCVSSQSHNFGAMFCPATTERFLAYRGRLLLGSREHERQMSEELQALGFVEGEDFWLFSALTHKIITAYFGERRQHDPNLLCPT